MKPTLVSRGKMLPAELPAEDREPASPEHEREHQEAAPVRQEVKPTADALAAYTRVVPVSPLHLENERVLPPGAAGMYGVQYKMLRTQVLRRLDKLAVNSLAVVGAAADTGKTLTAINLAVAIAADPERTALLIDLDLRKPSIHRRFGLEPEVGIDDCLRQGRPLREAMVRFEGYERFVLLPARERSVDSSELLSTRRTEETMLEMRERYRNRVLVFDLPPVPQADDVLVFARHVQAALIVVAEGRTRRDDLLRTIELLRDVPIIGTVLNGTREPVKTYY
jgi:Mrp family chromosome partitioning ATPase